MGVSKRAARHRDIMARFVEMDFDPVYEMIEAYRKLSDPRDQVKAASEMVAYIHPKLRSVEHKIPETHKMVFTLGGTDV